jgi:hypothetical protein
MPVAPDGCWACGERAFIRLKDGRAICARCFIEGLRGRAAEFERITAASRRHRAAVAGRGRSTPTSISMTAWDN